MSIKNKHKKILSRCFAAGLICLGTLVGNTALCSEIPAYKSAGDKPKIVNIVNFIRLLEPRDPKITEDVLYQTVVKQVELMKKYHLKGTFLLQYDALMDKRYQVLLAGLPKGSFEIGDWRANIGFSTGYTQKERIKLIDTYMNDFKSIFGYYPKSVGSWFIDAYSLNYMYEKYHIVASCNCKDQYGTDGYTLWGGYWNQAYYPSKVNAYMPAQHAANQVPVPIFRMLGSDPIRQYGNAPGQQRQGVITLEPVYPNAGGDSTWVNWFFKEFVTGASTNFAYTQGGQENSFTWDAMKKGLTMQFPLIAKLRDERKVKVETLEESGRWFKEHFKVTPPTSVTINNDLPGNDEKTVWFDSRYYRANLLWENGTLRFRDIHLFDEKVRSAYETQVATSNECSFFTLPVVDGYLWSTPTQTAGLLFKVAIDGKETILNGGDPVITDRIPGHLTVTWPLKGIKGTLKIDFTEKQIKMSIAGAQHLDWYLDLNTAKKLALPFTTITNNHLNAKFEGAQYTVTAITGKFSKPEGNTQFRLTPTQDQIILNL